MNKMPFLLVLRFRLWRILVRQIVTRA